MRRLGRHPAPALVLACALGCGPHARATAPTVDNRADLAPTAPTATPLADDVAALTEAARAGERLTTWTQRVTFLGWTAEDHAAYRLLRCDPDELGGRGPYCELRVCVATAATAAGVPLPTCADAASFELYGEVEFDAAHTTATAEAAVATLGPLAAGPARPLTAVSLTVADLGLAAQPGGGPRRTVIAGTPELDLGVVEADATYVGDSPDGRRRAAVGMYRHVSEYEGVRGEIPNGFAVVECAAP